MPDKWYERAIRRNVVDMHIPDWNEEFMSRMDPVRYADLLAESKVQSTVLYAHSHAGTCFYPTRVGHMHAGLQGRDLFGELVGLLHERGIYVQAYHSLIYDTWAYSTHPDFRMVATMNDDASTFDLPEYIHSRLQPQILIDFPEAAEEMLIMKKVLPFATDEVLAYVVGFLQRAHEADERYTVRDGINIARYALKTRAMAKEVGTNKPEEQLTQDALEDSVLMTLGEEALRYIGPSGLHEA